MSNNLAEFGKPGNLAEMEEQDEPEPVNVPLKYNLAEVKSLEEQIEETRDEDLESNKASFEHRT